MSFFRMIALTAGDISPAGQSLLLTALLQAKPLEISAMEEKQ